METKRKSYTKEGAVVEGCLRRGWPNGYSRASSRCSCRRCRASLRRRICLHASPHTLCVSRADDEASYHCLHSVHRLRRPMTRTIRLALLAAQKLTAHAHPSHGDPAGGTLRPIDRILTRPTRTAKGKRARGATRSRRELRDRGEDGEHATLPEASTWARCASRWASPRRCQWITCPPPVDQSQPPMSTPLATGGGSPARRQAPP